ncbi:flagellar hook-basal body complex protein [Seohaeicola saemankumensis]|uniref:flagellar hook-basal body complex protein n=1 Tax=Seohaeicola saemankumensis TaxID=481181 RepID=UPI001E3DCBF1|nr:flagellar hook-basal body complex protein [Seohaeicola saemankumensis]MCD1625042.1 flagellar hook-basal body complex protein [Seohaeicola saemankumensis]
MDNAIYTNLTRQTGLLREMQVVANNIANTATTGFRQDNLIFSEHVKHIDGGASLSMATASVRNTSFLQGALTQTSGPLDLAIEGDGFFLIETPQGQRLTRSGHFSSSPQGELVTSDGNRVLDTGGAPVFLPPDAIDVAVAADGTLSAAGVPLAQIGLMQPVDPENMLRETGVLFRADAGFEPADSGRIVQGFLESSNVDPINQIARMIEVQRAYEMGQSLLEREDERIRAALNTFIR